MEYIASGVAGFLVIHLFDLVSLKRLPLLKPVIWLLGGGLVGYSLVMLVLLPGRLALAPWSVSLGWVLLAISLGFLVYSLFVNLPFRRTYLEKGVGDRLVKTGFYALSRHPGVIWFGFFLGGLILASGSRMMALAAPVFFAVDVVLVVLEDRVFFPRMFPGYRDYQKETPMLFPDRESLKKFFRRSCSSSGK